MGQTMGIRGRSAVVVLLAAEVLDELVFGAREAAWPLVRQVLGLSYAELGLLLGLSTYGGTLLEPFVVILGATRWRRWALLGGGLGFALTLTLLAAAEAVGLMVVAIPFGLSSWGAWLVR